MPLGRTMRHRNLHKLQSGFMWTTSVAQSPRGGERSPYFASCGPLMCSTTKSGITSVKFTSPNIQTAKTLRRIGAGNYVADSFASTIGSYFHCSTRLLYYSPHWQSWQN